MNRTVSHMMTGLAPSALDAPLRTRPESSSESGPSKQAPADSTSASSMEESSKSGGRTKLGCLSCRLRKKRCDETKPTCLTCARLGIECLGYGAKRPRWARGDDNSLKARKELTAQIMAKRSGPGAAETEEVMSEQERKRPRKVQRSTSVSEHSSKPSPVPVTEDTPAMWAALEAELVDPNTALPLAADSVSTTSYDDTTISLQSALIPQVNGDMVHVSPPSDPASEEMWRILFGPTPTAPDHTPIHQPSFGPTISPLSVPHAPIYLPFPLGTSPEEATLDPYALGPPPAPNALPPTQPLAQPNPQHRTIPATDTLLPDLSYLHHYLNVVLPLQYRFAFRAIAELVTPLAVAHPDVLNAVSSLAAMHLVTQRTKAPMSISPSGASAWPGLARPATPAESDADVARLFHAGSLQRLRYLSSKDLTSEDVIVSALFAISFYLFSGGTGKGWVDVLATARRCLSSVLAASPEFTTGVNRPNSASPWKRYRPLIQVMIWMDVFGSVTQNKASQCLPVYRQLLTHYPSQASTGRIRLHMEQVMGCDDTTFLALAEIVQLSEWRSHVESAGCLSIKELMSRAASIEKLLDERSWRESQSPMASIDAHDGSMDGEEPYKGMDDAKVVKIMSDIFHSAARVLLASVINGPWPRVHEVASAVEDTISNLALLDLQTPPSGYDINRALIFPITLAGCHAASKAQHDFFRSRFSHLGPEATAFGNTQQALHLMEEVWARRQSRDDGARVDWREVMRELGWEAGILLV